MGQLANALSEKSKRDDALIVGSEIGAALQELTDELDVWRSMDCIVVGKGQTFIIEGNK